jgi:electron transport complex protein RnfG
MKPAFLSETWLVLVMALVVGVSLGGIYTALDDRIRTNAEAEARSRIAPTGRSPGLVPQADANQTAAGKTQTVTVTHRGATRTYTVYRAKDAAGRLVGWVVKTSGQGFNGPIDLLLAIDPAGERIIGFDVLAHTETPTVGDRITQVAFRRRVAGASAAQPLVITRVAPRAPAEVQAITGATISSRSVVAIINAALSDVRTVLPTLQDKD